MTTLNFEQFEAQAKAQGFDEVLERTWAANTVVPTHSHPFAVHALVISGELWLTVGEELRQLRAGDTFQLDKAQPHAERYGSEGAVFWAARRNG